MKTLTTMAITLFVLAGLSSTEVTAQERTGYVMRVEGRLVFIDLGAQDEVIPNDLFRVIRQETIIHPVTGENLGGEVPLGMVRVVEIFPRYSFLFSSDFVIFARPRLPIAPVRMLLKS